MNNMEKLVTLSMPEHDISQGVIFALSYKSHSLWDNYSIFLSRKKNLADLANLADFFIANWSLNSVFLVKRSPSKI